MKNDQSVDYEYPEQKIVDIGMEKEIGSIEAGKKADLVVCNDNIDIKEVYIGGKAIM